MKQTQVYLLLFLFFMAACANDDGDTSPATEVNFSDVPVTAEAAFSARNRHTSVVFDDKMWVIGGNSDNDRDRWDNKFNDIWYSSDGANWTEAVEDAPFSARINHTSVVFDNKMWVIGGDDGIITDEWWNAHYNNDVWYSSDGVTWTEATDAAQFSARVGHTSVVFDDKIWVIGGYDGSYINDVWYSSDGITWTEATSAAPFSGRNRHSSVVFDDKIWVIGGYDDDQKNDVWYSSDGISWTEATAAAPFSIRESQSTVVFDNKIWVIDGFATDSRKDDIWYSSDGINWTETTETAPFSGRYEHTSVVFDDKIWVIGGYDSENRNDVWAFD